MSKYINAGPYRFKIEGDIVHWQSVADPKQFHQSEPIKYCAEPTFEKWCDLAGTDLKIAVGSVEDMEIVWIYDNRPGEDNFGYALNLDIPYYSEWGYAPFPAKGETHKQHVERWADGLRSLAEALGGDLAVVDVGHPEVSNLDQLIERVKGEG